MIQVPLLLPLLLFLAQPLPRSQETPKAEDERPDSTPPKQARPNIVFILADDLGYKDLACYGNTLHETPHLDRLAKQGVRFTQAYANAPNCAPSRASIMSGQYAPRHGIYTVGSSARGKAAWRKLVPVPNRTVLDDAVLTLPELLHTRGYVSAQIGKWHLGEDPRTQGFDVNIGGNASGHPRSYFSPYRNPDLEDGKKGEYLTDRLTDEAIRWMTANKDKPFFLYMSHYTVHTPIQARPDLLARHGKDVPRRRARYAAMVESLDESTGRILDTLDELELVDDTLVIFFSDNGGHGAWTTQAPLRGAKGMLYEGGIREPLILRWPGHIAKGSRCDTPVIGTDFLPTLCELAGVDIPASKILDGKSLLSYIQGGQAPAERPLFWHFPAYLEANAQRGTWRTTPACAMRLGRYKLIEFFEDSRLELYDLETDISESHDLSADEPELTKKLHARMLEWRRAVKAPLPQAKPK